MGNNHYLSSYRQACLIMNDGIINKNHRSPSCTALNNGTDTTRRVRFKLESKQNRTILPSHLSDYTLRQFERMSKTCNNTSEKQSINSIIV